jgi:hypothetical protein
VGAKKKRTALPRVTVLAYNRRELAAFVAAVETLRLLVEDLRVMLEKKKGGRKTLPPVSTVEPIAAAQ